MRSSEGFMEFLVTDRGPANIFQLQRNSRSDPGIYRLENSIDTRVGDILLCRPNGYNIDARVTEVKNQGAIFQKGSSIFNRPRDSYPDSSVRMSDKRINDAICFDFDIEGLTVFCNAILENTNYHKVQRAREPVEFKVQKVVRPRKDKSRYLLVAEPKDERYRFDGGEYFLWNHKFHKEDDKILSWWYKKVDTRYVHTHLPELTGYESFIFLEQHDIQDFSMHIMEKDEICSRDGMQIDEVTRKLADFSDKARQYNNAASYQPLVLINDRRIDSVVDQASLESWGLDVVPLHSKRLF